MCSGVRFLTAAYQRTLLKTAPCHLLKQQQQQRQVKEDSHTLTLGGSETPFSTKVHPSVNSAILSELSFNMVALHQSLTHSRGAVLQEKQLVHQIV